MLDAVSDLRHNNHVPNATRGAAKSAGRKYRQVSFIEANKATESTQEARVSARLRAQASMRRRQVSDLDWEQERDCYAEDRKAEQEYTNDRW